MRILFKLVNLKNAFTLKDVENVLFSESLFNIHDRSHIINNIYNNGYTKLSDITEMKTHSLNILRALFRHCQLGELVKDYIAEGFIIAFRSYDGKSWAVSFTIIGKFYNCFT